MVVKGQFVRKQILSCPNGSGLQLFLLAPEETIYSTGVLGDCEVMQILTWLLLLMVLICPVFLHGVLADAVLVLMEGCQ